MYVLPWAGLGSGLVFNSDFMEIIADDEIEPFDRRRCLFVDLALFSGLCPVNTVSDDTTDDRNFRL